MILAYKGVSSLSKAIRFINWSEYSHVSFKNPKTGQIIEAWSKGVTITDGEHINHTKGTVIDYFDFTDPLSDTELTTIWEDLKLEIGKPYDWIGVFHFLTRRPEYLMGRERWFCSELVFKKVSPVRILLKNIEAYKVYPAMITYSPTLSYKYSRTL